MSEFNVVKVGSISIDQTRGELKMKRLILTVGSSKEATDSGRWKTNYVAHLDCGHNKFMRNIKPNVGSTTNCEWCKGELKS